MKKQRVHYIEPTFEMIDLSTAETIFASFDGNGNDGGVVLPDDEWKD